MFLIALTKEAFSLSTSHLCMHLQTKEDQAEQRVCLLLQTSCQGLHPGGRINGPSMLLKEETPCCQDLLSQCMTKLLLSL